MKKEKSIVKAPKVKVRNPNTHAKSRSSRVKQSKNYKKPYHGQGRY